MEKFAFTVSELYSYTFKVTNTAGIIVNTVLLAAKTFRIMWRSLLVVETLQEVN